MDIKYIQSFQYEKTIKFYSLHLKTGNQGFLATENNILEKNYEIEGGRYLTSWPSRLPKLGRGICLCNFG